MATGTGARGAIYLSEVAAVTASPGFGNRIRVLAPGGAIATLAGAGGAGGFAEGPGTAARFDLPRALVVDAAEATLYVVDDANCRIRRVYVANGTADTLTGAACGFLDGYVAAARFRLPRGLGWGGAAQQSLLPGTDAMRARFARIA